MSRPPRIVTLLTDFGLTEPYAGVMKGALLKTARDIEIVDLSHGIAPQGVPEAAFWLDRCYRWFPEGTVHVCVVDPGVGTARAIVALHARGHFFLAPDNGCLPNTLLDSPGAQTRCVDVAALGLRPQGTTFHGRDIFAPIAAQLASGLLSIPQLGPRHPAHRCRLAAARRLETGAIEGLVVVVDHFGNLLTNIEIEPETGEPELALELQIGAHRLSLSKTYSDVPEGHLLALSNAWGIVEVAVRCGSAAQVLGIGVGATLELLPVRLAASPLEP